jgi:hypothetical protein
MRSWVCYLALLLLLPLLLFGESLGMVVGWVAAGGPLQTFLVEQLIILLPRGFERR